MSERLSAPDSTAPAMPLEALRVRYEALGRLEEHCGERTIISRCLSFPAMLANGAIAAHLLRESQADLLERGRDPADALRDHPELSALVLEAWPSSSAP